MDDFESGAISDWQTVGSGSGDWFVYTNGQEAPDPAQSDPNAPFDLPDPPQGKFAVVTDMDGPGTRILYRDVGLDGRFTLHLSVFYAGTGPFSSPETLAHDGAEANQQFRIDLVGPSAPIDSVEDDDVLVNVFHTAPGDPSRLEPTDVSVDVSPWAGQTVRLRLAGTDNQGPLRVGVDNVRFEPIGTDPDERIELPVTPEPSSAVDLVLHRMTEGDALAALSARAEELADTDEFSGAVLVARDGEVLLQDAWGLADREAGTPNTPDTRFRIGSMNKMFHAVATLQVLERPLPAHAGALRLFVAARGVNAAAFAFRGGDVTGSAAGRRHGLRQGRNDFRGFPDWIGQVVRCDVDDCWRQERHQQLRDPPRARCHAENRVVHVAPHSPRHADQELHQDRR